MQVLVSTSVVKCQFYRYMLYHISCLRNKAVLLCEVVYMRLFIKDMC